MDVFETTVQRQIAGDRRSVYSVWRRWHKALALAKDRLHVIEPRRILSFPVESKGSNRPKRVHVPWWGGSLGGGGPTTASPTPHEEEQEALEGHFEWSTGRQRASDDAPRSGAHGYFEDTLRNPRPGRQGTRA